MICNEPKCKKPAVDNKIGKCAFHSVSFWGKVLHFLRHVFEWGLVCALLYGIYVLSIFILNVPPYKIGENGPMNGIIFHYEGSKVKGWHFLEAFPNDLRETFTPNLSHSDFNQIFEVYENSGTNKGINRLSSGVSQNEDVLNILSSPSVLAYIGKLDISRTSPYLCINLNKGDWYQPRAFELALMRKNLYLNTIGDFSNLKYISVSYKENGDVIVFDFRTGKEESPTNETLQNNSSLDFRVRPIRYFYIPKGR
ncbi:MAG: hypothetical protein FWG98_02435 [Candidatus Cloacimonetes bacterium]|nr:hypothetical protein [Candidatus Cloacimonadota bacterium]